jgi:hypothetical protein
LKRERVFGLNLRFYPLRASYLGRVKEGLAKHGTEIETCTKLTTDFCGECASCPFAGHGCEIMRKRQAAKKK